MHLQKDVVNADGAFGGFFAEQASNATSSASTSQLLDAARAAGGTVVYTRVAWQPDQSDLVVNSPILGIVAQTGCLVDGTRQGRRSYPRSPPRTAISSSPTSGSADSPPATSTRCCAAAASTPSLFTGVATNFSVEGTARQASDLGYRTVIVADACSAADPATHDASIASLGLLAEIATSAEVIAALSAATVTDNHRYSPGTPRSGSRSARHRTPSSTSQVGPWRTRVLQAGPADGEPLILMPGTGGHLEAYAHNIPRSPSTSASSPTTIPATATPPTPRPTWN